MIEINTPTLSPFGKEYTMNNRTAPIGIFDSGYGGLTILKGLKQHLPQYDYLYLGDNARSPYGSHTFQTIYRYTKEAVTYLFKEGCPLVILACNTASARALRTIQQWDLAHSTDPSRRVLGVIRPTVESIQAYTHTNHVGLLATPATVQSNTYGIEIANYYPQIKLTQHAAPIWVPLVEQGEYLSSTGVDFFVQREIEQLLKQDPELDVIQLACTHYPLLLPVIQKFVPPYITILGQSEVINHATADYLKRHPEMENRLTKGRTLRFLTTENDEKFGEMGSHFMGEDLSGCMVEQVILTQQY